MFVEAPAAADANKFAAPTSRPTPKSNCGTVRTADDCPPTPLLRKNSELSHSKFQNRLKNKTRKIKMYWGRSSSVIPNVFKMHLFCRRRDP